MEGIEVLKVVEITKMQPWILPGLIISVVIFILTASCSMQSPNLFSVITTFISGLSIIIFMFLIIFSSPVQTGEYEQTIRVSNDISLNEFYEKYEILSKEEYTNVYTVKERTIK